jgi:HSP20 family protein
MLKDRRVIMNALIPIRRQARDLWDVAEDLNRVFDAPMDLDLLSPTGIREGLWHPTMDVYNRAEELVVELEVPGVKKEDLDLTIEESHLIVEGKRTRSAEYKEDDRYFAERAFGGFHRIVHLPVNVDAGRAEARFAEGVLTIRLPKTKREGGTKIGIKTE